jgi:hypothetical protein
MKFWIRLLIFSFAIGSISQSFSKNKNWDITHELRINQLIPSDLFLANLAIDPFTQMILLL